MKLAQKQLILVVGIITLLIAGALVGVAAKYHGFGVKVGNTNLNTDLLANTDENTNNDSNTNSLVTESKITADWKVYVNKEYQFEFKYPSSWILEEDSGTNFDKSIVSIMSSETKDSIDKTTNNVGYCAGCGPDLSVYYYSSVSEETFNKLNKLGATTIDELIDKDTTREKLGTTKIGGKEAIEVKEGGFGTYYELMIERDGALYRIFFNNWDSNGMALTGEQKAILSTFRFIDDDSELSVYTDDLINTSFQYPSIWGPTEIEFQDYSENSEGTFRRVLFSGVNSNSFKTDFQLNIPSKDFAPGREVWLGEMISKYETEEGIETICNKKDIYYFIRDIRNCENKKVNGKNAVEFTARIDALGGESVLNFVRIFAFETNNQQYPAALVALFLPLLDQEKWVTVDSYPDGGYWDGVLTSNTQKIDSIYTSIKDRTADDYTNIQLKYFEDVINSLSLINPELSSAISTNIKKAGSQETVALSEVSPKASALLKVTGDSATFPDVETTVILGNFDAAEKKANLEINYSEGSDQRWKVNNTVPNGYAPNPSTYSEDLGSELLSYAKMLYRAHYYCDGKLFTAAQPVGAYDKIDLTSGYSNVICRNRQKEQCEMDGSFDHYYDERCDYGVVTFAEDSTKLAPNFSITVNSITADGVEIEVELR
jgi:hypothetical protein